MLLGPGLLILVIVAQGGPSPLPAFERVVIDDAFPDAYQVEVVDINGDGKLDIVALGGGTCAWYENPGWKKRIITGPDRTPGIITSASKDLDGDGKAEVAIGYEFEMNQPKRGKLALATQGEGADDPWTLREIGAFGSVHRIRWGDWNGDGQADLIAAPIFGPDAGPPTYDQGEHPDAVITVFDTGPTPAQGAWMATVIGARPVLHAIELRDDDHDGKAEVLTADNLGVSLIAPGKNLETLFAGLEGSAPARGASEIHVGQLAKGRQFFATIEPWHGTRVLVRPRDSSAATHVGAESLLDDTLDAGHALWVADVNGDGADEVFAGHRGNDHRVSVYQYDGKAWQRTVLDRDIAAQDLRGGDLDGDGTPDVVAVGGSTHNVIWYRPHPARPSHDHDNR